jgi:hypothetical protein
MADHWKDRARTVCPSRGWALSDRYWGRKMWEFCGCVVRMTTLEVGSVRREEVVVVQGTKRKASRDRLPKSAMTNLAQRPGRGLCIFKFKKSSLASASL